MPVDFADADDRARDEAFEEAEDIPRGPELATVGALWPGFVERLEARASGSYQPIPTGIERLDRIMGGGYHLGQFTMLCGSPGAGKTSFAAHSALLRAMAGHPALVWSIELAKDVFLARLTCQLRGVSWLRVLTGNAMDAVHAAGEQVARLPLFLRGAETGADEFAAEVRAVADTFGEPPLVVIDYCQLVAELDASDGDVRRANDRAAKFCRTLVKETSAALVLISAVARGAYVLDDSKGKPDISKVLGMAKESGAWEFNAGLVVGLIRVKASNDDGDHRHHRVWGTLAKNRLSGTTGHVPLEYDGLAGTFSEIADEEMPAAGGMSDPELKVRIKNTIQSQHPATKSNLATAVGGKRARVLKLIEAMIEAGELLYSGKRGEPVRLPDEEQS